MELIFNLCGEFRWSPEGPVSQIHYPHLLVSAPGIFSGLLRFVQMLKREWGAEINGKLPQLFIHSKTANQVPEFCGGRSVFGQNCSLAAWVWIERTALGQNTLIYICEVRRAQLTKSTLLTSTLVPLDCFRSFLWSVLMLKREREREREREWDAESKGKLSHLFIPRETATWFLSLRWKACLWTELQTLCLSLQLKTCPWTEQSDDINSNQLRTL